MAGVSTLESVLTPRRVAWLREELVTVVRRAYDENCARFDEELGDNATTFGICLFHNITFLLERRLEPVAEICVTRPDNSFVIETEGYSVHVYKAPPGTDSMAGIRFDQSAIRLGLIEANSEQLRLDIPEQLAGSAAGFLNARHLVVVHFGDPVEGLRHIDIGAPMRSSLNGLSWAWVESLTQTAAAVRAKNDHEALVVPTAEAVPNFGLRILGREAAGRAGAQRSP